MSIDLKVDNRGDFILSSIEEYPRLRIDWIDSSYKVLRIDFEQGEECKRPIRGERLQIDFRTNKDTFMLNKKALSLTDKEELRQRIMIKLRTELGEMSLKPEFGTYLNTQKHEDINSAVTQQMVQNIVYGAVYDMLENPSVRAIPKRKDGPFYCQNMNVYIYEDDELFFELEL